MANSDSSLHDKIAQALDHARNALNAGDRFAQRVIDRLEEASVFATLAQGSDRAPTEAAAAPQQQQQQPAPQQQQPQQVPPPAGNGQPVQE